MSANLTPEPIDGAPVLDEVHDVVVTYCVMSDAAADAVVLWIAATHALPLLPAAAGRPVRGEALRQDPAARHRRGDGSSGPRDEQRHVRGDLPQP